VSWISGYVFADRPVRLITGAPRQSDTTRALSAMRSTDQQPARSRHGEAITHAPSGEQFEIRHGDQRATIVEVGGGVREYEARGRQVLDPYRIEETCDGRMARCSFLGPTASPMDATGSTGSTTRWL
jgi:hypothetical protein